MAQSNSSLEQSRNMEESVVVEIYNSKNREEVETIMDELRCWYVCFFPSLFNIGNVIWCLTEFDFDA